MPQQCTKRNCALLQSQVDTTRRLLPSGRVPSRCSQAVCRRKRAHCKLESKQMANQTGASGPLGGATTAQGADREPSSAPAALAGRGIRGKNRTIDERYDPMDACAKTTSCDFELGATMTERRFLKSCSKISCPHPGVRHARSTILAPRSTLFSGAVGRPGLQSFEGGSSSFQR
jgi:hypothetical protein